MVPEGGLPACQAIREADPRPEVRVVLLAKGREDGMRACLRDGGPDSFLLKPISPADLKLWIAGPGLELVQGEAAAVHAAPPLAPSRTQEVGLVTGSGYLAARLRDLLEDHGLEVPTWQTAASAMNGIPDHDLSLLLVAAPLPDLAAEDFCSVLAEAPVTERLALVLLARDTAAGLEARARACQASGHLPLPVTDDDLLTWLRTHASALIGEPLLLHPPTRGDARARPRYGFDTDEYSVLLYHMDSKDRDQRLESCYLLGQGGVEAARERLQQAAFEDPEDEVRREATAALGALGGAEAVRALRLLIEQSTGALRERALQAMADTRDPGARAALLELLGSSRKDRILEALRALVRLGDPGCSPAVERLVSHPDPQVQANASWALRQLQGVSPRH